MKTGALVLAMTACGIVGGVVGALLAGGGAAPPPAPSAEAPAAERDEALAREVAGLRARLDEMQSSVAAGAQDAARLRAEVDREKKAAAESRAKLEALEGGGPRPLNLPVPPEVLALGPGSGRPGRITTDNSAMAERMRRTLELLRKPEDERWAAIREALGLNTSQEEELKAALKERDLAIRDLTKVETREVTGPDGTVGTAMSVTAPDPEKLRDARRRYDERVNGALTAEQAKKWRDEGYEGAAGGGISSTMVVTTMDGPLGETK